jgi:hypothetical protein
MLNKKIRHIVLFTVLNTPVPLQASINAVLLWSHLPARIVRQGLRERFQAFSKAAFGRGADSAASRPPIPI